MKNTLHSLSDYGKVFMGKNPGFFRTKIMVFAAVDSEHCIIKANKLITARIFKIPKVLPFNELESLSITDLDKGQLSFEKYTSLAVTNLFKNYTSYQSKR